MALSARSCPIRAHVSAARAVPCLLTEIAARFPEKRMIRHSPADLMMSHLVSDARTGKSARRCGLWRLQRQPQIFGVRRHVAETVGRCRHQVVTAGLPDRVSDIGVLTVISPV